MHCKNFLKVYKSTGEKMFAKYLSADGCFVKTIILLTVMITTIQSAGFYPSTFLQRVNSSKNSILNWVYLYKYFFVCLSWKTLNRYFIKSNLILRGNRYKNPGNKVTKQRRSMDVGFYNAIPKETYIAKWKKLYMNKR